MIDRILVPLDGSRVAEQILPHLRRLLHRQDAEVILVRAAVPPPMENGMLIADVLLAAARDYLTQTQEHLRDQGVRVRSVARVGAPAGVILEIAEEERATMIALATHGETGLKRLLAGSIAEAVLRRSPVPVLLVRPFWSYELLPGRTDGDELRPMRNLLVPMDKPEDAALLLPPVTELARLFDARVVLLHVMAQAGHRVAHPAAERSEEEAQLARLASQLEHDKVEAVTLIENGEPAHQILEAARANDIDLIAMSTHARGGFLGLFSSSVTEKVLRESTCPMLVVHAPVPGTGRREQDPAGVTGR
ncbi:MAG TPA: universal stress protein [Planctomycetota bacterium]|nr:universal stress protein [Planctomycetota bacterium]